MGSCLLNEISDNLAGHRRKSAKTKRPLIGTIPHHMRHVSECVQAVYLRWKSPVCPALDCLNDSVGRAHAQAQESAAGVPQRPECFPQVV
jgi:hypothetical protein